MQRKQLAEILKSSTPKTQENWQAVKDALEIGDSRDVALAARIFATYFQDLESERVDSGIDLAEITSSCLSAFDRLSNNPIKSDPGCLAKTAIIESLQKSHHDDESFFLTAVSYQQPEPVWNGSVDTAAELRVLAAFALVDLPSSRALGVLVDLLMDPEPASRAGAARGLGSLGNDAARYVLRLKTHLGDPDPQTFGECCASLLQIERSDGIQRIALGLQSDSLDHRLETANALGGSRLPEALGPLQDHLQKCDPRDEQQIVLNSIALISSRSAIEYLFALLDPRDTELATGVVRALAHARDRAQIRSRLQEKPIVKNHRGVARAFCEEFGEG